MIDENDYIIKHYYSRLGRHKPKRWVMHYCDNCGCKRSYAPRKQSCFCRSCACIGRIISQKQKESISKALIGNKNHLGNTPESRLSAAVKSCKTKRCATAEKRLEYSINAGAGKMGLSVEEYLKIKDEIAIKRKIAHNMRSQIGNLIRGKVGKLRYVDWSMDELKQHLESLWQPDMNWDNYGRKKSVRCWEIDHVIPIRAKKEDGSYIFTNIGDPMSDDFKQCFKLSNLQPLWADINNSKNNNYRGI